MLLLLLLLLAWPNQGLRLLQLLLSGSLQLLAVDPISLWLQW
jgi:hypothetical protein